jgi:hypothetical protein
MIYNSKWMQHSLFNFFLFHSNNVFLSNWTLDILVTTSLHARPPLRFRSIFFFKRNKKYIQVVENFLILLLNPAQRVNFKTSQFESLPNPSLKLNRVSCPDVIQSTWSVQGRPNWLVKKVLRMKLSEKNLLATSCLAWV